MEESRRTIVSKLSIIVGDVVYFQKVSIPEKVSVDVSGMIVKVSGEKGNLERNFSEQLRGTAIKFEKSDKELKVSSENEEREIRSLIGTIRGHIKNMIDGVTSGFTYKLKIVYSHFPVTVKTEKDKVLIQNFLGERTPRVAKILGNTQVKIEGQEVFVTGSDLEKVSQTAANIEQACRIVGYDKKIFQDGIYIVSKGD